MKERSNTKRSVLAVALLLAAAPCARALSCPLASATISFDGEGDPAHSRHVWLTEAGAGTSPGPVDGTVRVEDGLYSNLSELFDDPSLSWMRLRGNLRIDSFSPWNEYSGAVFAATGTAR